MTSDSNCVFCKIISGNAPSEILFQNEEIIVFKDIKPAAQHHFLVVPKNHIVNINYLVKGKDKALVEGLVEIAKKVLEELGGKVDESRLGFHLPPFNSIGHLHLHVISPVSEMGFISRQIFRPNSWWFQTVDDALKRLSKL